MDEKPKFPCFLTGNTFYLNQMLLFKEMNDFLVCDVNARINEKGIWCNPSRYDIEKAIKNQIFDKLLKKKLKIQYSFMESIENNLKLKVLNLVGLSKKAGLLEIGNEKVLKSLKSNSVDVVLIAKEDSKLDSTFLNIIDDRKVLLNKDFSRLEISKAVGYKNVLCVAIIISKLSATLKLDFYKLMKFKLN